MKTNTIKQKAYKVCGLDIFGQLNSWAYFTRINGFNVVYHTDGRLIRPSVGKLMVFDNVRRAVSFTLEYSKNNGQYEIWEVETYGCLSIDKVVTGILLDNEHIQIWIQEMSTGEFLSKLYYPAPAGTLCCDSLKMIRKIK